MEWTTKSRIELSELTWPPSIDYSVLCRARTVECVRIDKFSRVHLQERYKTLYELKSAEAGAKRYATIWTRRNLSATHVKQIQALGSQLRLTLRSIYPDVTLAHSVDVLPSPPGLLSKKMTIKAPNTGQDLKNCGEGAGWQIEPTEHDMVAQGNPTPRNLVCSGLHEPISHLVKAQYAYESLVFRRCLESTVSVKGVLVVFTLTPFLAYAVEGTHSSCAFSPIDDKHTSDMPFWPDSHGVHFTRLQGRFKESPLQRSTYIVLRSLAVLYSSTKSTP